MSLIEQIGILRKEINTDSYPMSLGEIINLYRDNELDIHPEFQRLYRWSDIQKSRLIESILLGIPLPSFFVSQRSDGIWDVIDGLQRLSTIFSFIGIYKDENGEITEPLRLVETEHLNLEGMYWDKENELSLPKELQRTFKREKIDFKIIKNESDPMMKYELFQRLNTYGSELSDQEVRNCLLIMMNREMFEWLKDLSNLPEFTASLPISENKVEIQYYMELATRFIILKDIEESFLSEIRDINDFITMKTKELANNPSFDYEEEGVIFLETFKIINSALGEDSFRKYDGNRYKGPFLLSIYEVLALGVGYLFSKNPGLDKQLLKEKIIAVSQELSTEQDYIANSGSGYRANQRLPKLIPLGRQLLS
ncbi:DUF262 domain-containing protein [Psychrobacter sp. Pi2-52]|uniref:DUF262 domain-containing protein n=1 Tax=Psychrobacter sp. Pi2-52 TaxID=2774133 RepID=UPI0019199EFB|nr:DUF262 domain-containing protein [Psychrobacter sp. Pi2-52]